MRSGPPPGRFAGNGMRDVTVKQALALSALLQAVSQIQRIAWYGQADLSLVRPCITGLLGCYRGDIGRLYGGDGLLRPGLQKMVAHMRQPDDVELTRYVISVMYLERKLLRNRKLFSLVTQGLERARQQAGYFHCTHENVISNLGSLYCETLSQLRPRIMVRGEQRFLEERRNAELIRALLLSAVRAVTLWREAGGSRLKLLVHRQRMIRAGQALLHEA